MALHWQQNYCHAFHPEEDGSVVGQFEMDFWHYLKKPLRLCGKACRLSGFGLWCPVVERTVSACVVGRSTGNEASDAGLYAFLYST